MNNGREGDRADDGGLALVDGSGAACSTRRCRELVAHLLRAGDPVGLTRLACHVAAVESGHDETEVPKSLVQAVYLDLHREHVPRLVDAGVVEYSPGDGVVEIVSAEAARRALRGGPDADRD